MAWQHGVNRSGRMANDQRPAAVNAEVRAAVEAMAKQSHRPAGGNSLMLGAHALWLLIGRAGGGSRLALAALAEVFTKEAGALASAYPSATAIGALGRGWTWLRADRHEQADEAFAGVPALEGVAGIISCLAECGRAMGQALANKEPGAKHHLAAARAIAGSARQREPSLLGWLDFTEALILYRRGHYPLVIAKLAPSQRAFRSPFAPGLRDFPGFEAEALLLQAKAFREMALYAQALEAVQDDVDLREQNVDLQGQVWALLEQARIHRFQGQLKDAERCLNRARRLPPAQDQADLLARIEDQRGDLARAAGDLLEAERHYREAEALAARTESPELQGHVANSRARLLEDQDRSHEALELLRRHESAWHGPKGLGKYLYLKGSLHFRVGDEAEAERLLTRAIGLLQDCGMQSYEALAHSRLAEVLLKQGRKDAACREWAAALRIAPRVQAGAFLEKLQARIGELRALDLLEVVARLLEERAQSQTEAEAARAAARLAAQRNFKERYALAHWFVRPVSVYLREPGQAVGRPPPVVQEFARILDNAIWFEQEFARSPAGPIEAVDITALIKTQVAGAADLGPNFKVVLPERPVIVHSQALYLGQALLALFRGAKSAFGTRRLRLLPPPRGKSAGCGLRFALESPRPRGFEHAAKLVPLDAAVADARLAKFFKQGYTGDFTLLDFLVAVALWGEVTFDLKARSINLTLPRRDAKGLDPWHT